MPSEDAIKGARGLSALTVDIQPFISQFTGRADITNIGEIVMTSRWLTTGRRMAESIPCALK